MLQRTLSELCRGEADVHSYYQVIGVVTYQENWDDTYNPLCFQRNILRLGSLQTQNFNGYM